MSSIYLTSLQGLGRIHVKLTCLFTDSYEVQEKSDTWRLYCR